MSICSPHAIAVPPADRGVLLCQNWMAIDYMAGEGQQPPWGNVTRANVSTNAAALQSELATSWHYGVFYPSPAYDIGGSGRALVEAHPEWTLDSVIIRQQTPGRSQISNKTLPKGCYMQNANGQLINLDGKVLPAGTAGSLRVTTAKLADVVGCPDSLFAVDAAKAVAGLAPLYANCSTCAVSRLNEDGEYLLHPKSLHTCTIFI